MKNIYVLPTSQSSRLFISDTDKILELDDECIISEDWWIKNQNIYITSDEEIKEGDWVYDIFKNACPVIRQLKTEEEVLGVQETELKIILTTDQDLTKDGVQAIDDEFLEWFVNNPSCEEVEIVFNNRGISGSEKILKSFGEYKIIIPKEEPKQVCENCKIEISKYGCACGKQEEPKQETLTYSDALKKEERIFNSTMMFKQETLEEVAEKILANNVDGLKDALNDDDLFFFYKGVIQCYGEAMAKWQQEQMYSKEEVIDILMSMPVDSHTNIIEWFETFKNK